jgi:hypothetical protein
LALPEEAELLCGVMRVYSEEEGDEYDTLITKEAYSAWRKYIENRVRGGEKVTSDSPAVLTRTDMKRWKAKSIANSINDLMWEVGLRTEQKRRHEVQMAHGFRKFYDNVAKDHIEEAYVEKLIGHDTGTKEYYDRHLPIRAVEQYLLAMPFLSIDEAYRNEAVLSKKLREVEKIKDEDVKDLRYKVLELSQKNVELADGLKYALDALKKIKAIEEQKAPGHLG